jgi:hypothetical protein
VSSGKTKMEFDKLLIRMGADFVNSKMTKYSKLNGDLYLTLPLLNGRFKAKRFTLNLKKGTFNADFDGVARTSEGTFTVRSTARSEGTQLRILSKLGAQGNIPVARMKSMRAAYGQAAAALPTVAPGAS